MEALFVHDARLPQEARASVPGIIREKIMTFEHTLNTLPGAIHGDSEHLPLIHTFAEGCYVREIFIPAGSFLTGKIHKHAHPNFLMQGKVIVVTEQGGRAYLEAPLSMISHAGTKRAIYALTDTIWITVHVTQETDLDKIEDYVIAKDYAALQLYEAQQQRVLEEQTP